MVRLCSVASLLLLAGSAHAADFRSGGNFGLGLGGGTFSSGISGKYYLSDSNAIQGVIGTWGYTGGYGSSGFALSADYLWEMPIFASTDPVDFGWNVGAGAALGTIPALEYMYVGIAGVIGIEANFNPVPIDIVLEYRPTVVVVPGVGFGWSGLTGHVRYYF